MKKAILSPLCSAFIIPGLGQVFNQDLKKGVVILSAVFLLFIAGIIKLYRIIRASIDLDRLTFSDHITISESFREQDISLLWYLLAAFGALWLYSVVDAHLTGKKIDQLGEGNHL